MPRVVTSGSIRIDRTGSAWLACVSGTIRVESADAAEIKTVSGTVSVGSTATGRVAVRSVSGKVEISVPPERAPAVHLKSISGELAQRVPAGQRRRDRRQDRQRSDSDRMQVTTTLEGAIVFTDIVGFTELTDTHGDEYAVALLERQEELVRAALPETSRVVKELGDGLLLWFDDACDALRTCLDLQQQFEREAVEPLPLWVRIGVHWGSPRRRGDDIIGRDVNLASRIVDLAAPGEVLCSEATADHIGPLNGIEYEPLGPVFVRGFADPIPLVRRDSGLSFSALAE